MVKQHMKKLGFNWESRTQIDLFEDLFRRRLEGEKVSVSPALEANFLEPADKIEERIKKYIDSYKAKSIQEQEELLFAQKKRLADAERKLSEKPTKTAQKEKEVAGRQIERIKSQIKRLSTDPDRNNARIWPHYFAPLIVSENGERVIKPMRYLLRPMGFGEDFDKEFSGAYNARRDNLSKFWRKQYLRNHGILIISSFFENVTLHDFENRKLKPGEKEEKIVIQFKPEGFEEMIIPCIWDRWSEKGHPDLFSFALITDEPPKEISDAGHDRCPIFLKKGNVDEWLNPEKTAEKRIKEILDDKETPFYVHEKIA
jgi:putative SOS response-associated peptidase YedK